MIVPCSVPDCDEPVKAKQLCAKHHQRMLRTGVTHCGKKGERSSSALAILLNDIKAPKKIDAEKGELMEKYRTYGIVRKIDDLGRFVLPKEYSIKHGNLPGLPLEFFVDEQEQAIVLKVYNPGCFFCGSVAEIERFKEKKICHSCKNGLMEVSILIERPIKE